MTLPGNHARNSGTSGHLTTSLLLAMLASMVYPGGKERAAARIINLIPPHDVYIEPFLGGGAVLRAKRPARLSIGVDLDPRVIERWSAGTSEVADTAATAGNGVVGSDRRPAAGSVHAGNGVARSIRPARLSIGVDLDRRPADGSVHAENGVARAIRRTLPLRALDLFCGAGGATKGLQMAGFHVTGIDVAKQPRYCGDAFIQGDALTADLSGYDFIWASPPCQQFSCATAGARKLGKVYPDLIKKVRARLVASGLPYVIENVKQAPLIDPMFLDGTMFPGLKVIRKRAFESNVTMTAPASSYRRAKDEPAARVTPEMASEVALVDDIRRREFWFGDGIEFLKRYPFTGSELVYCDPPYPMETRSSGRLYHCEMTDAQHRELLAVITKLPCKVLISGYSCSMYREALAGWRSESYTTMTRGGETVEWLWYNYQPPAAGNSSGAKLHDYRYLGANFREREKVRRKAARWKGRLARLPEYERVILTAFAQADTRGREQLKRKIDRWRAALNRLGLLERRALLSAIADNASSGDNANSGGGIQNGVHA